MSTPREWTLAFARQARADLDTWFHLKGNGDVPECHKLLFLQMACEKLTKAYLCNAGSHPGDLQASHCYTAKHLPAVIRKQIETASLTPAQARWIVQHAKQLAQEIELLAPAIRRGGQRPDNCEYPWKDALGRLHVPLDWTFAPSKLLEAPTGRTFLKLLRDAATSFS